MSEIKNKFHAGDPIVDSESSVHRSHSTFNLSRRHLSSSRFGEVAPRLALDIVPDDRISAGCGTSIDTFTLSERFRGDVRQHRDTFFVPYRAIYNRSYDIVVPLNTRGSEPSFESQKTPFCAIDYRRIVHALLNLKYDAPVVPDPSSGIYLQEQREFAGYLLQNILGATWLFSPDSLPSELSMPTYVGQFMRSFMSIRDSMPESIASLTTMTALIEELYGLLPAMTLSFSVEDVSNPDAVASRVTIRFSSDASARPDVYSADGATRQASWRDFPQVYRLFGAHARFESLEGGVDSWQAAVDAMEGYRRAARYAFFLTQDEAPLPSLSSEVAKDFAWNYTRLIAYQMSMAQYYTEQDVDDIFSARRWYELMDSLCRDVMSVNYDSYTKQTLNGTAYMLEPYAGGPLTVMLYLAFNSSSSSAWINFFTQGPSGNDSHMPLLAALFGKAQSLRYRDYFIGARPQPLATGSDDLSVYVPVNSENSPATVSAVDMSRAIGVQRLLNFANSVGRKARQYVSKLFGVDALSDSLSVIYLGSVVNSLHALETDNTGEAQVSDPTSSTSVLRSRDASYQFNYAFKDYGVLLSVIRYSARYSYFGTADRTTLMTTKYDLYNPFMQYQGDQSIRRQELFGTTDSSPYGYVTRDLQYKTAVDIATGAYQDETLSRFNIIQDWTLSGGWSLEFVNLANIRQFDFEFNKYFVALVARSPATYFHFLDTSNWDIKMARDMAAMPKILA